MPNRVVIDTIEITRTFLRLPIDRYAAPDDRPSLGFISTKENGKVFEIEVLIDDNTKRAIDALYLSKNLNLAFQFQDDTLNLPTTNTVVFNSVPSYQRIGRLWQANLSFFEIGTIEPEVIIDTVSIKKTFLRLPVERFAAPTDRPALEFISTLANGKIFEVEALLTDNQKIAIDNLYILKNLTETFNLINNTLSVPSTSSVVFNAPPTYEKVGQFWRANLSFFEIDTTASIVIQFGQLALQITINLITELPLSVLMEFGTTQSRSVSGNRITRDVGFVTPDYPRVFTIVCLVNNLQKQQIQIGFNNTRFSIPFNLEDNIDQYQTFSVVWAKAPEFRFVQQGVWQAILSLETA